MTYGEEVWCPVSMSEEDVQNERKRYELLITE